jgi:ribosomal protein S18 acetylase RimI-like enzyme
MTIRTGHVTIRDATRKDCLELARLIDIAGEGLPFYLWQQMAAPGEDPWKIGQQRAARDSGGFSYRNSAVAEVDGMIVGALVGYPVADEPEAVDPDSTPPMFVPLRELENLAAGTWYLNSVAVFPEARGMGVGSELMHCAEQKAAELGLRGLSLIVAGANQGARKLYERLGYREVSSLPMVKEQWQCPSENWVLMIRELPG